MEKKCEECLARGFWEGKHGCPPWLKFLVSRAKDTKKED